MKNSTQTHHKSCRRWTGATNSNGYGIIAHKGKTILAHNAMCIAKEIVKPKNTVMWRTCRKPDCINHHHFEFVSKAESMRRWKQVKGFVSKLEMKARNRKPAKIYSCLGCGEIFSAWYTSRKYCDYLCRRKVAKGIEKKCKWCKKKYNAPIGLQYRSLYCSDECLHKYQVHHVRTVTVPYSTVFCRLCPICNKGFRARRIDNRPYPRKYCSDECLSTARVEQGRRGCNLKNYWKHRLRQKA